MSIITTIVVISILILVHEVGHFLAAKKAGLWVEEFGIGIPPRLFGKKIGDTIYSVNLLPFGGFVRLHGENDQVSITKPKRAFLNQSKKTRAFIVIAGVLMNFLLAIAAFALVYSFSGIPKETENVRVIEISDDSPAQSAGFKVNDVVIRIGDKDISSNEEFIGALSGKENEEVVFVIEREGELIQVGAKPRENPPEGEGPLGVVISSVETYFPPIWQRLAMGVYYGFKEALFWTSIVVVGFVQIIAGLFRGIVPQEIAGPVGIYALTTQAASFGSLALINFVGILSVNLMILNILPFPALDGGRLVFIVIESFVGRKVVPKVESIIHAVGMAILLLLLIAITYNDIKRLIEAGGISGFVETVLR